LSRIEPWVEITRLAFYRLPGGKPMDILRPFFMYGKGFLTIEGILGVMPAGSK